MDGNKATQHSGPSWCRDCLQAKVVAARGGVTGPVPEPQPVHRRPPCHMLKEMKRSDDKRSPVITVYTKCGVSGRPIGMYGNTPGEVSWSGWRTDVTCPICLRLMAIKVVPNTPVLA